MDSNRDEGQQGRRLFDGIGNPSKFYTSYHLFDKYRYHRIPIKKQ